MYGRESLLCVQYDLLLPRFGVARIRFSSVMTQREQQD